MVKVIKAAGMPQKASAMLQRARGMPKKADNSKACKWCALGQCWTHQRTAKPAVALGGIAKNVGAKKVSLSNFKVGGKKVTAGKVQPKGTVGQTRPSGKLGAQKFALVKAQPKGKVGGQKDCKWCLMGECWSHGQIAKPGGAAGVTAKKKMLLPKATLGAQKGQMGGKKTTKMTKMVGKTVPKGFVQKHMLKQAQLKAQAVIAQGKNRKDQLYEALHILLDRNPTKDDLVYDMEEEDGKHSATLSIAGIAEGPFKGKPAASKKEAQQNAAGRALALLQKDVAAARREKGLDKKGKKP
jgi:hypothetical protein